MTKTVQPDVQLIRREEKAARLSAFIQSSLVSAEAATLGAKPVEIVVVARTGQSPVIHALTTALSASPGSNVRVSTILTDANGEAGPDNVGALGSIRLATDRNLREAHEQIVIGDQATWIGDCMRRDPTKLDAFERFVDEAEEVIAWARIAFDRLWAAAHPIRVIPASEHDGAATIDVASLPATSRPAGETPIRH
ncbi:MAG: hypothetical protein AAFO62_10335 [Pseudomonadota bacterium]